MAASQIAKELATYLASELARAWQLELGIQEAINIVPPAQPILGSELHFAVPTLPTTYTWKRMTESFAEATLRTTVVQSWWFDDKEKATIWMLAGREVYTGIRLDHGLASRVHSVLNDLPFDSPRRIQLIKLKHGSLEARDMLQPEVYEERQMMSHYLRASERLNAPDVSTVMDFLARHPQKWDWIPRPADCKSYLPSLCPVYRNEPFSMLTPIQ